MTRIEVANRDYFDEFFKDVKAGQIVADIGAFTGDTVDLAIKHNPNIKIIAIEPIKHLCEAMQQRFTRNPNISIVNKAAWSSKITTEFNEYEGWAKGLSTIQPNMTKLRPEPAFTPHILKYPVDCDTLDNILAELNIDTVDYIKIDTEGSEDEVLAGFKRYHADTRFHIESHITNLENILQRLLEMSAQIDIVALSRDSNIKEQVLGIVIGQFISPEMKKEPQQQIKTITTGIERRQWIHSQIKVGEKILDIGSADGWIFKDTLFVPNVTSIDLDLYDIPNFIRMDAQELRFDDNSFDVAVMGEILEHVDDPICTLKEAKRVAQKIIITVPDEANWSKEWFPYETKEETAKRRRITIEQLVNISNPNVKEFYRDGFKHLFHGRHYTEETLRSILDKVGIITYEINRLSYDGWSFFVVNAATTGINAQKYVEYTESDDKINSSKQPKNPIKTAPTITYPEKKLRIALISTPFFMVPPVGYSGLEQIVWDLAEGLDELGHQVTIFAPDGSQATKHGHIIATGPSVNTVNVNWFEEEKRMYKLYKNTITPERFDICNGHTWFGFEFLLKIGNPKINVIHTHHGNYTWDTAPPLPKVDVVAISKFMKGYTDNYFKNKGFNNVSCTAVYNGIDLRKYHISDTPRSGRLLFVGRLSIFKKPDLAIEVAKKLNIGLDIVGGTFVDSLEYLNKIRVMCDGTQIKLYEDASHETKIKLMQSAKCLLFCSQMGEPFGLVLIEAMACGLPVIALNDGAVEEIVQEGGIVCDVFDKKITANGWQYDLKKNPLDALIEAVGRIDTTSQQARNNAEKFSREAMAKTYEKLYRSSMGTGN
jgi:FkbM family methyltransferase